MSEPGAVATGSRETFQNDLTELLSWTPITERKSGQQLCHRREEAKYLRALPSNVYEKAPKARDATAWAKNMALPPAIKFVVESRLLIALPRPLNFDELMILMIR